MVLCAGEQSWNITTTLLYVFSRTVQGLLCTSSLRKILIFIIESVDSVVANYLR